MSSSPGTISDPTICVISDIHSNAWALDAVLEQIPDREKIFCLGDITGYYTEPNEVCRALQERDVSCILGNHDLYALGKMAYPSSREDFYRTNWTRKQLSARNLEWLTNLPRSIELTTTPSSKITLLQLHHGYLNDPETYVYSNTPIADPLLEEGQLLLLGHTHHPMVRTANRGRIANPGSVGQPRDWNPKPSFLRISLLEGQLDFMRVRYDAARYVEKLSNAGVSSQATKLLLRTRSENSVGGAC